MPYKFKYEVLDEDSGNNFNRREEQDSQVAGDNDTDSLLLLLSFLFFLGFMFADAEQINSADMDTVFFSLFYQEVLASQTALRPPLCTPVPTLQGNLSGEYRLLLPDGRIQVVTYTATHYGGFVAKVSYEGGDAKDADDEKSFRPSPSYNPNQQQDQSQQPWRTKKY